MKESNKQCMCPTRNKIIKSAEMLFSKYGYASVSMDDIAKEVEITKAALYYHFDGKEKLFLEMMVDEFAKFEKLLSDNLEGEGGSSDRLKQFIINYINFSLEERNFAKIIIQKFSPREKDILKLIVGGRDRMIEKVEPFIKNILRERGFDGKCDSYFMSFMLMGVLHNVIANELIFQTHKWSAEHIAEQILILMPVER
ncbi:MAG: TetR/AcrR family transcriptional regulator [Candidatus Pacebacteria bacterium]|nr:TetR/AcrR family transcriptional regulator [Candidatus Paceibacterota bacterium]